MNRRSFVRNSVAFAAATQARPILGANDRVNHAVIGVGGRGRGHLNFFNEVPNVRLAAICDVNQAARERAEAQISKLQGSKPKAYPDMRSLFDDKEIDGVSIATPNHWHALTTIWACQAGKDVYVEKPASHSVWEGRQMVAAARKHDRMVQVGSQSRSNGHKLLAMKMLREGVIGEVYMARGMCYRRRYSIGYTPEEPVPAGLDWDMFLGPAPMRGYTKNRFDYNWHWFWDTGNGDIGNQGVHEMDICRWGLGLELDDQPETVVAAGGKFVWKDDQETPNIQQASFVFGDKEIMFDTRNLQSHSESEIPMAGKNLTGNIFYGADGYMIVHPQGFQVFKGGGKDTDVEKTHDEPKHEERNYDPVPHMANFVEAVRHRDHTKLNAEIAIGVEAAALCHYANAGYRVGRRLSIDANGMAAGDSDANGILKRVGRPPYEIPEIG